MTHQPGFAINDVVEVVGDGCGFGHNWPPGTLVRLMRFDPEDGSWRALLLDSESAADYEWIGQSDVRRHQPEPTDEEIAQLFGLATTKHCPTCTCGGTP